MSKHKRLHTFNGRNYGKFAGFVSSHYPPPTKICYTSENKKTAPSAANTEGGGRT